MKRREKKSESLDIRLPHQQKLDFMAATKQRGETASQALRRYIDSYIEEARLAEHQSKVQEITMTLARHRLKTFATAAGAAIGVFSVSALPSAADSSAFEALDKNKDGVITEGEIAPGFDAEIISRLDTDGSGGVSPEELEGAGNNIVIKTKVIGDGEDSTEVVEKIIGGLEWTADGDGQISGVVSTNASKVVMIERLGEGEDLSKEELVAFLEEALDEDTDLDLDGAEIDGTTEHVKIIIRKDASETTDEVESEDE